MTQPTKTTKRKAKLGFCSLIIKARKVAVRATPTILMISMAEPPSLLKQKYRFYFLEKVIHYCSYLEQYIDKPK
jgi:hypothetical protein